MSEVVRIQDPAETLDYSLDWTAFLGTDTISSSAWAISPTGPVLSGPQVVGRVTTIIVSGLVFPQIYRLTNTVITAAGRTSDRSIVIRCINQ